MTQQDITSGHGSDSAEFDEFADDYEAQLNSGLSLSGEDSTHFAEGRVELLTAFLDEVAAPRAAVLDFGCGTGSTVPFLAGIPGVERVVATDESNESLRVARNEIDDERVEIVPIDHVLDSEIDVAYCNGVFHHIVPAERPGSVAYVNRALRDGGYFALWENNPWNPGTRLVMKRIPFDRDAIMLSSRQTRKMLAAAGFEIVRTEYAFIFPKALKFLRPIEKFLSRLPLGAQYSVIARKVASPTPR